jgi:DNA-binding MarR family transcriptional regulator
MNDPGGKDEAGTADVAKGRDPGELMFWLIHGARALESRMEDALAAVGTSLAKHGVLTLLVEAGEPLALSELAARQSCVRSNMTQLVDRLEADGYVERTPDPNDRRSVRASLTRLGRDRQAAGVGEIDRVKAAFTATLSARDLAALERVVSVLD